MDVWEEIVARDSVVIAEAVQRTLIRTYVERRFQGKPLAVDFKISKEKEASPKEVAELAATLRNAGYTIARDELEEATGFTLEEAPQPAGVPPTPFKSKHSAPLTPTQRILNGIAKTILDGSKTLEEALKEAKRELDEAKLADLAGDLQEELEKAMFSAAAQAAAPTKE